MGWLCSGCKFQECSLMSEPRRPFLTEESAWLWGFYPNTNFSGVWESTFTGRELSSEQGRTDRNISWNPGKPRSTYFAAAVSVFVVSHWDQNVRLYGISEQKAGDKQFWENSGGKGATTGFWALQSYVDHPKRLNKSWMCKFGDFFKEGTTRSPEVTSSKPV